MNQITERLPLEDIEAEFLKEEQVECPVIHKFIDGYYVREVHMPAGALVIGHFQKFKQLNVFIKGKVMMFNTDGSTSIIEAPMTFMGNPGRKIGYIIEDVVWQNLFPTDETDVAKLEETYLLKSQTFEEFQRTKFLIDHVSHEQDRKDFLEDIAALGFTPEQVTAVTLYDGDKIDMPVGDYKFGIFPSPIHGHGVFASSNIKEGEFIGPSRIGEMRTPLGRYTNHSRNPNGVMVEKDGNYYLVALRDIRGKCGGDNGEEITVDYRHVRKTIMENEL